MKNEEERKPTFIFDLVWADAIRQLDPEMRLAAYEAIVGYAATGRLPDTLPPAVRALMVFISTAMDKTAANYAASIKAKQDAGRRSGELRRRTDGNRREQTATDGEQNRTDGNRREQTATDGEQNRTDGNRREQTATDGEQNRTDGNRREQNRTDGEQNRTDGNIYVYVNDNVSPIMGDSKETPPPYGGGAKKGGKPPFRAPTLEEVFAHAKENGYAPREAERFWNYQTSKGWKVGSASMKDWHAALRNWILKIEQDNEQRYGQHDTINRHSNAIYGNTAAGRADRDAEAIRILAESAARADREYEATRLGDKADAAGGGGA